MAKQSGDNKTAELPGLPAPKRRGRPPSEAGAMSNAERQRRWRERQAQKQVPADVLAYRESLSSKHQALKDVLLPALYCVKHAQVCGRRGLQTWSQEFLTQFLPDLREQLEEMAVILGLDPSRIAHIAGAPKSKRARAISDDEA